MRVFISHSFLDEELASTIQQVLKKENIPAYMAQRVKEYEVLVSLKIRQEVENSDYVISIITKHTRESASVNQELGYAQGKNISIIAMIEEDAKIGALINGMEYQEFNRNNFSEKCNHVKDYIIERGARKRESNPDVTKIFEEIQSVVTKLDRMELKLEKSNRNLKPTSTKSYKFDEDKWYEEIVQKIGNDPMKSLIKQNAKTQHANIKILRAELDGMYKQISKTPGAMTKSFLQSEISSKESILKSQMQNLATTWSANS